MSNPKGRPPRPFHAIMSEPDVIKATDYLFKYSGSATRDNLYNELKAGVQNPSACIGKCIRREVVVVDGDIISLSPKAIEYYESQRKAAEISVDLEF